MADLYQMQGLFEVSEQKLLKAQAILPDEPVIDFALGELYFTQGAYGKAVRQFKKRPKKKPSSAASMCTKGWRNH